MLKDTTRCHQWARTQDLSMNVLQRSPMLYHYVTGVQINQLIYLHVLRICCTSHFCIWLMLAKMATLLGKSWSLALHACYNILWGFTIYRNGPERTGTDRNGPKRTGTDRNGPERTQKIAKQTVSSPVLSI